MITKERKPTFDELVCEVKMLRSAVIGRSIQDPEGEYKPEFAEKILRLIKNPTEGKLMTSREFARELRQARQAAK